jgi:hypothetical protein
MEERGTFINYELFLQFTSVTPTYHHNSYIIQSVPKKKDESIAPLFIGRF